ncbi:MAG: glutamate-1-semialdehyde 2,1-aminomutase [Eubacteriaceae bacterium]|nr:glutamate-1-semialdehyde 2,1-aminomutase [Eubacteriaceae bacterium]
MNLKKSEELFIEAQKYIPGGVNSPVRAFKSVDMASVFAAEGHGARLTDVDGNEYIDYICSWGPLILGHSNPVVYEGAMDVFKKGITFGLATEKETEIAKLINELYPSVEMIRMVNSGTEATMSAIRLARGFTGKDKIVKFEGCYHGHFDGLLVKSGSGTLTYNTPTSSGVPRDLLNSTIVGEYNNIENLEEIFKSLGDDIAGLILEPVPGNMGIVPAELEFLKAARKLTEKYGALLIFDEVITGFRIGLGGAAELYGIKPDITCFGKIIGGGLPVGAYGGRRDIMSIVAPLGGVYQAGTLSGNPLAMHLGLNTLKHLKNNPEIYTELERKAIILEKGFKDGAEKHGAKITVNRVKGMLSVFMNEGPVNNFGDVMKSDTIRYAKYFKGMLNEGILFPPAQFEALFLSSAHTDAEIEKTITAHETVLEQLTTNESR